VCRLLLVQNAKGIDPNPFLKSFRRICQNSREYQGHGWGCAWLDADSSWQFYHQIAPIWQDKKSDFADTTLFLVHARSAFRDEGIKVENNMPFSDGKSVFLFNGELQGVRIKADGRIGAEKIYNFIKRFDKGDLAAATRKGVEIIDKRTRYVRAMNFFLAEPAAVQLCSWFGEDPAYFQMHSASRDNTRVICSEPLAEFAEVWDTIPNHTVQTLTIS